jgi:subfamily B ATP-binding cassette protein MsbA
MKDFIKILRYIVPYWRNALLNLLYNLLSVIFSLFSFTMAIPFLSILFGKQEVVTKPIVFDFSLSSIQHNFYYFLSEIVREKGPESALISVSLFMVFMVMLKTGFMFLGKYVLAPLRNGVLKDIRNKIYNKILSLHVGYFSEERKGDIMSRMTNDVQELEVSVIRSMEIFFKEPITILVYLVSLIYMSPQLTLFAAVALPVSGFLIGIVGRSLRRKSADAQSRLGLLLSIIEETLSGLRVIKAFNAQMGMRNRFESVNDKYNQQMIRLWRRQDLALPLSEFLATLAVVLLMWYGGSLVLGQNSVLTSAEFIGYLVIFSQIIAPAKSISTGYYSVLKGLASADRIDSVLTAHEQVKESPEAVEIKSFEKAIEFKNVSFSYVNEPVLKNINLKIERGKTIALVGQSGSGKSTLVDLLARFYDVNEGEILVDGHPIKSLKLNDLRALMGNVNQEPIFFNDTVARNIAFGLDDADIEDIKSAARVANAHGFVMEMPQGYDSNIGDRGGKLSGGQRQRLGIARAVMKNPPILILDEATSALDTESERLVQEALMRLMQNRTSVVIAHRLSTIVHADEIIVLHRGEIVERGKHNELLALNAYYKKLYELQSL